MHSKNLNVSGSGKFVGGVDFSGAKEVPNDTWLAIGNLSSLGVEIVDLRHVGSHKLINSLLASPPLLALGLDFPFSLPNDYNQFLASRRDLAQFQAWQEVAECLAFLSFDDFLALANDFQKESKRYTDKISKPTAQSPLHRGNPSMIQMTFQGIRFLASLDPSKYSISPFQDPNSSKCQVMEVYPSATLNAFKVPYRGYKSKEKKDRDAVHAARKAMIRQLMNLRETGDTALRDVPRLSMSKEMESATITSDDAFDAIIACYTAAIFVTAPRYFSDPLETDNLDVLTEGWIYHPDRIWVEDKVRA
jgi:hypothetical protein